MPKKRNKDMRKDSARVQSNECKISFLSPEQILAEESWPPAQQRILEVLEHVENRKKPVTKVCQLAGFTSTTPWMNALKDKRFVARVEALGVPIRRHHLASHLEVQPATNIEEELAKDTWDLRRIKRDYPKHKHPSDYEVDFSWIANAVLREQIKRYFRLQLPRWKASTFKRAIYHLKPVLTLLPAEISVGTLTRNHIEALLPEMGQLSEYQAHRSLREMKIMVQYMASSPAWTGPRPPRFLIWDEDLPGRPETLPRPIAPPILDQLDLLLEQAIQATKQGRLPKILSPHLWDAIFILRHTGMRSEDLSHLKAPDIHDRNGCLDQDSEGYWWVRIHHQNTKMGKDHRIPTRMNEGVIDAIRRQRERIKEIPDHFGEHYLFRTLRGVLTYGEIVNALRKLAPHLIYEGEQYIIAPHQFRHSLATDMIEQGVDIYTVKEFLGHASLSMTEKYVKVYLTSLKAKYDAYRLKKQQTYAAEMMANQVQLNQDASNADGGWVEDKVGKLYVSPLPDGIGNCTHLAMLDPCPTPPHCPTCPKLRANKRHLPVWENKAQNLLITVEALRANPAYARARQKHEQELQHTEKVIKTIQEEGFWDGRIHNS
jgi:integrase